MLKKVFRSALVIILCCFCIYVVLSSSSWNEPLMGDHLTLMLSAKGFSEPGVMKYFVDSGEKSFGLWHPPLYMHFIAFMGKFLGINRFTARYIGIAAFLGTLFLIYLLACELFRDSEKKKHIALAACLMYSLNPLVIRGSLLIDQDGTVLNTAVLLLMYFLARDIFKKELFKKIAAGGALLALIFWLKFVTPIILMGSIFLYNLLRKNIRNVMRIIQITLAGIVLFCVTWYLYCKINDRVFIDVFGIYFTFIKTLFASKGSAIDFKTLGRNIWAPVMWYSPSLMILAFFSLIKIFTAKTKDTTIMHAKSFAFYGIVVFIFYIFIGGISHGFPKYHCSMVPVFTILIAAIMVNEVNFDRALILKMSVLGGVLVLFYIYFVQDPLYLISYALKEDIILTGGNSARRIIIRELMSISLLLLTIPIAYLVFKKCRVSKAFLMSLFTTGIAFNISLSLVQCKAKYSTVYCYGGEKVKEAADFIRQHTSNTDIILAPREFVWLSNNNLFSYKISSPTSHWNNKDKFLGVLKENDIRCVAYGICANTISQYRRVLRVDEVQKYLRKKYTLNEIGSYSVWIKQ